MAILKAPTERDVLALFEQDVESHPRVIAAFKELRDAAAEDEAIGRAVARINTLRESGSQLELLSALSTAPTEHDDAAAKVRLAHARAALDAARQGVRAEREAAFAEYQRPHAKRFLDDVDALLERHRAFLTACERRHEALSGSVPFLDSGILQMAETVGRYRDAMKAELDI